LKLELAADCTTSINHWSLSPEGLTR